MGFISYRLANGNDGRYRFSVSRTKEGYTVAAWPRAWQTDGRRSFYSDETQVIRESCTEELANSFSSIAQ
jgi:hypothetical protein